MFTSERPVVEPATRGVRDQSSRWQRGDPQPASAAFARHRGRPGHSTGPVPDRLSADSQRTLVRPGCLHAGSTPSESTADAMTSTGTDARSSRTQRWALAAIDGYQRAFSGRPSPCRFFPSCSTYAHDAYALHGTRRGSWLTLRRLLRCRPFGSSGYDPVPEPHDHCSTVTDGDHSPVAVRDAASAHKDC